MTVTAAESAVDGIVFVGRNERGRLSSDGSALENAFTREVNNQWQLEQARQRIIASKDGRFNRPGERPKVLDQ